MAPERREGEITRLRAGPAVMIDRGAERSMGDGSRRHPTRGGGVRVVARSAVSGQTMALIRQLARLPVG